MSQKTWRGGVDLGGQFIKIGIRENRTRARSDDVVRIKTLVDAGPEANLKRADGALRSLLDQRGVDYSQLGSAALIMPGLVDRTKGTVTLAGNLPGWADFPMQDTLAELLGVKVHFNNDANAAALGVALQDDQCTGADSVAAFSLGSGIGAGLVFRDKIWNGSQCVVEFGHVQICPKLPDLPLPRKCTCGLWGCLEAYCGAWAIKEQVNESLAQGAETSLRLPWNQPEADRVKLVFDLARQGDEFCRGWVRRIARYLAIGVAQVVKTVDPQVVAFVGGLTKDNDQFLDYIKHYLFSEEDPLIFPRQRACTQAIFSTLRSQAGWIGATYYAEGERDL